MLKAFSVYKDLDKNAIKILNDADIEVDLSTLKNRPNKDDFIYLLNKYDILIIGVKDKFTEDIIKEIKTNKIIATLSIGLDHIDSNFFNSNFVKVINCQKSNVTSVAEHIFSLILGLKKRLIESNNISSIGGNRNDLTFKSKDISGCSLGLIGAGKISREVIKIANIFNMKVFCNTLNPQKHTDLLKWGVNFLTLDELLKTCDIISVNIPLYNENKSLISKDKIQLMKKNATFINTSRAEIVDMDALISYAEKNKEFNVGLDIDAENYFELLKTKRNNVIVTPHTAGVTKEAVERMDVELAENIVEFLNRNKFIKN